MNVRHGFVSAVLSILFVAAVLLQAPTSFAQTCPDLTGTYLCLQNDYRTDTLYRFEQNVLSGDWVYRMTAQPVGKPVASVFELRADGIEREVVDLVTGRRLTAKVVCKSLPNSAALDVTGEADAGGMKIRFQETLSRTQDGDLRNVSLDIHGNVVSEICQRQ